MSERLPETDDVYVRNIVSEADDLRLRIDDDGDLLISVKEATGFYNPADVVAALQRIGVIEARA